MKFTQHKEQKVAVFVDVQNMYYSAKNLYSAKVDFGKVLSEAVSERKLIRAFTYVIRADVGAEKEFFEALHKRGYEVRAKDLQVFYGGTKKGDWDVGLCMDVIRMLPKIDVFLMPIKATTAELLAKYIYDCLNKEFSSFHYKVEVGESSGSIAIYSN